MAPSAVLSSTPTRRHPLTSLSPPPPPPPPLPLPPTLPPQPRVQEEDHLHRLHRPHHLLHLHHLQGPGEGLYLLLQGEHVGEAEVEGELAGPPGRAAHPGQEGAGPGGRGQPRQEAH